MRHLYRASLALAVLGGALVGCQQTGQSGAMSPTEMGQPVVRWTSLLCSPTVRSVGVSVQNVAMGTKVVFESAAENTEALRSSVEAHARPASGQNPATLGVATNVLPGDTRVTIEDIPSGTAVTYAGTSAAEEERIREVIGEAAQALKKGQCTMLRAVEWEAPKDRGTDEPFIDQQRGVHRTERPPRMMD